MDLRIHPYNKKVKKSFQKEKGRILKTIGNFEVHHIGSTAVPGLGGKGVIDILVGISHWEQAGEIIDNLKKLGFSHIHPKEKGRIFLSKDTSLSLNNIHIHIAVKQSKAYKELLFFRDYLRRNRKEAKNYYNLKLKWLGKSSTNREKYQKLKSKYINRILKKSAN